MALPKIFKPFKCDLLRCGSDNDGGYLISKKTILDSKSLISFGILDDCTFEKDFQEMTKTNTLCFDRINYKNYWKKRIYNDLGAAVFNLNYNFFKNTVKKYIAFKKFFKSKKNILEKEIIREKSLTKILNNYKNKIQKPFLFKIDIEGSEYRILDEIIEFSDSMTGVIIEFHDLDLHLDKVVNFLEKLNFKITHIHGNNFERVIDDIPIVLEVTLEKNPVIEESFSTLPNQLDQACNADLKDIDLKFN